MDGYAGQFADYEGLTVNALEAIDGAGDAVVDDGGDVAIEDHRVAVTEGLDRLRKIAPTGVPALDEDSSAQLFRSDKALFMRNWPVKEDLEGAPAVTFDVAPLPSDSGVLGGQSHYARFSQVFRSAVDGFLRQGV